MASMEYPRENFRRNTNMGALVHLNAGRAIVMKKGAGGPCRFTSKVAASSEEYSLVSRAKAKTSNMSGLLVVDNERAAYS